MKHRWSDPHEWLLEKMKTWGAKKLEKEFLALLLHVSRDDLQDIYEKEMEKDDYFEEHLEPEDAKVGMKVRVMRGTDNETFVDEIGEIVLVDHERARLANSEKTKLTIFVALKDGTTQREGRSGEWFAPHELTKAE